MRAMVDEAMAAGAIGVSTGLYYEPASAAPCEEVIEICRPLSQRNGIYCTHMRDEGEHVLDSLEESFRVGRELGVPVVISHHKVAGKANHGRSVETLPFIEKAMRSQEIGLDCYPYHASSTILSASRVANASKVMVTWSKPHPEVAGMELVRNQRPKFNLAVEDLLPAGAIYFSMDEKDVQRILGFEHTMIGSDGLPHDAAPHPRLWGSFPRVLGHYSRSLKLFPLETAVHKMTGLTAKTFGLAGRGVLKEGFAADIAHLRWRRSRRSGHLRQADPGGEGHRYGGGERRGGVARRQAHRRAPRNGAFARASASRYKRGTVRSAGFQVSECTPPTAAKSGS